MPGAPCPNPGNDLRVPGAGLPGEGAVDAGEAHAGEGGGLEREGAQVLDLEVVDGGLAARLRKKGDLHRHRGEEARHPLRRAGNIETLLEVGLLGRDADRAEAGVA